ncbi:MAG: cation:proton antiporter [Flavobacteriales bacterium]|nr:cation:proton antiporter [Flavobacteriales bacterium]
MENYYLVIMLFSILVIFSYGYTQISRLTKIPSVIFLIITGILIHSVFSSLDFHIPNLQTPLKLLGLVGLMMIVLEGALDLHLQRDKLRLMLSALATSILILGLTNFLIAGVLYYFLEGTFQEAFIWAIPLSVVSSAIVIPSVHRLAPAKKEFMVVESTLSDIFGIMLFDFMLFEPSAGTSYWEGITWNIIISIVLSIVLSFLLVYVFSRIKTDIKFFLFLSILALLFAIGKYFHYSALLIILIFGVILNNTKVFFIGPLKRFIKEEEVIPIRKEFVTITNETSFLIRTFFFVVFGMTMNLEGFMEPEILIPGALIMLVIFITRAINLSVFVKSSIFPEMLIAPRGLVTILLYQKLNDTYGYEVFDEDIIAIVIIGTNIIMMLGLMLTGKSEADTLRKTVDQIHVGDVQPFNDEEI